MLDSGWSCNYFGAWCELKQCDSFSLDTEWKSELINSRHFDKEIGHQNPGYLHIFNYLICDVLCVCVQLIFHLIFES